VCVTVLPVNAPDSPEVYAPDSPEVLQRVQVGLPIVDQVAWGFARFLHGTVEVDDLIGYGRIGLLAAARRFDPRRGIPFEAYATFRVRGAVLDAVRGMALPRRTYERIREAEAATRYGEGVAERTFIPKRPMSAPSLQHRLAETLAAMATAVAVGLVAEVAVQDGGELTSVASSDPEEELSSAQFREDVARIVDGLPHEERELIRRHYFQDERFDLIAKDLKIAKSVACEWHSRAIKRLGKRLRRADPSMG
jgi:RNA polymerase sigma factor for flagellar operon FliA